MKRFYFYRFVPSDFVQDDGTRGEWVETTEDNGTHIVDVSKLGQAVVGSKDLKKLNAKMKKYIYEEITKLKNES